ncbi:MAG: hypothetical protein LC715_04815, partial [Gammaproteobacteria bacterium]|nr:hypothetical protein [Gammaproteobacteria bacterium]
MTAEEEGAVPYMNFMTALKHRWRDADSLVCVGLDPESSRLGWQARHLQQTAGLASPAYERSAANCARLCHGVIPAKAGIHVAVTLVSREQASNQNGFR